MLDSLNQNFPKVQKVWTDMGYQGKKLKQIAFDRGIDLEIVRRPRQYFWVPNDVEDVSAYLKEKGYDVEPGFKLLPKRRIVERTFAWMGRYRRMSKDYEFLPETQEMLMKLALMKTMLKRFLKLLC